jgi:hypothetical protein
MVIRRYPNTLLLGVVGGVGLSLPVADALAPRVTDAVGVRVEDLKSDCVDVVVLDALGVADPVPVGVGDPLAETVFVAEPVPEFDPVALGLAPGEAEFSERTSACIA